jgi:alkylation response protein AidB-like acyl-CoA dehydrogenase
VDPAGPEVERRLTVAPSEDERAAFRADVEAWFALHAPRKGSEGDFSAVHIVSGKSIAQYREAERHALDISVGWQRLIQSAGFSGRSWPAEYGGQGGPGWQDEEIAQVQSSYGISTKVLAVGLEMLPPVLFTHGSEEQRLRYLAPVFRGEETWCQLLSEPDAGSDLGSAKSFATPVAGGWAVSGQKVWTSGAGTSDFALLIARTDKELAGMGGLSCFLLDMTQPGVEVRPLRQMSGAFHFNEVFMDSVFVPQESLVGKLGDARAILRTMLSSERAAIGGGTSARVAQQLIQLAGRLERTGEPIVRQELSSAYVRERVLDLTQQRMAAGATVPAGGSVVKLMYSEHARLCANLGAWLLGARATSEASAEDQMWLERLLFAPGLRLGGGTDEIQRNTISERGLSLPR